MTRFVGLISKALAAFSETAVLPWSSHPYLPPIYRKKFPVRRAGTLEDDYALGVIVFQFLNGEFPATGTHVRAAAY